ncbi:uncharacterized protein B0J16DRAFT_147898 [Fusarium flagelliforme]|uniref:uncharacterized protein n=1 Tax=Fusarium flagelliforme TaxID=2675880 RepID=UPI001E8DDE26|nr:uncharacterized protein B0J16DRAFT_147898 [Fusarium flagelliforme]KAH7182372.1 hypothetical protein B0J16DRAFT_147898 [Fusarium flagelliforme]
MDQRIDLTNDEAESIETLDRSNVMIVEGTVLDNNWVIGKQTGSTEHANIYSVTYKVHEDDSDITYEARSYDFHNISPQVKSNRARAIRRLSCRTVLSTTWNGIRVVIYRTGVIIQDKKQEMEKLTGDMMIAESACKSPRQKTTRQQESDRLRQLSRRRRVKQERKDAMSKDEDQQLQDYQSPEGPKTESMQPVNVDGDELNFLRLLGVLHGDEKMRQKEYLVAKEKEVEIDDAEALLEFIAVKEQEIAFLRRTNNKFKPVLKNPREYFHHVMSQFSRRFKAGHTTPQDDYHLCGEYIVLLGGLGALPSLILEAEELVQKLQLKLRDVRQTREKLVAKQGVMQEKKRLGKQIRNLEKWTMCVTIESPAWWKIVRDKAVAEERLRMLELNGDE